MAESPYPPYIPLRTIVWGRELKLETTGPLRVRVDITASRPLVWLETAESFFPAGEQRTPPIGVEAVVEVPPTDLIGWVTTEGVPVDPTAGPTHVYTAVVSVLDGDKVIGRRTVRNIHVPSGAGFLEGALLVGEGLAPSDDPAPYFWDLNAAGGDFPPAARPGELGVLIADQTISYYINEED